MKSWDLPRFERDFFSPEQPLTRIGDGELGGKAQGLVFMRRSIEEGLDCRDFPGIDVAIPFLAAITTEVFECFMQDNNLEGAVGAHVSDEEIARAFLKGEFPTPFVGDLRALAAQVRTPLAVRSSSLLEDSMARPFAGVYMTKMIPNNQLDADTRFRKLVEAIKLVWASTFFQKARTYRMVAGVKEGEERMAVVVQEVVGLRHEQRYYPNVSGVARSINYYPSGGARPDEGVVQLALGLGRTIVDGEGGWTYSPAHPKSPPPFNDLGELLKITQTQFWAVNMGPARYDPVRETEHMVRASLADAETDDTLRFVASTFDPHANRLVAGVTAKGPRLLDFSPLLRYNQIPLNAMVRGLLGACEAALGDPVEIEFAVTIGRAAEAPARCGFLQVRRLAVAEGRCDVGEEDLAGENVLVASESALGNGEAQDIFDVVYVRPEGFDPRATPQVALEVSQINERLVDEGRPYLLIGFGRWGTSDPWGGVPVLFSQVSGARAIVEAQLPQLRTELSQGSHFFHNLTNLRVLYLSVCESGADLVDWGWLNGQPALAETGSLRHVRLAAPLRARVDGRTGRGVVIHG